MKARNNTVWKLPMALFYIFLVFIVGLYLVYCYLSLSPTIFGINMKEFAANRNTYSSTLYAKRGTIYDNSNNVLALDVASYTVIAYLDPSRTGSSTIPYHVIDKEKTAEELSVVLDMTKEYLLSLLNKDVYQVELGPGGRGITEVKKQEIEDLNLPGISFIETFKRYYPNGDFASYIIGYAKQKEEVIDTDSGTTTQLNIVGELGIEVKFDEILKGINGYTEYQKDRFNHKLPDTDEIVNKAQDGYDIYLTIDSNVQRFVEEVIDDTVKKYEPEWLTLTVMDAKTGDILASGASPSFDPNKLNITNYENPLTSFLYEPGSVMKTFTYLCAIEKGTYKGNDTFLSGSVNFDDAVIKDWHDGGWGTITFDMGYELSSNVGTSYITTRFLNVQELKQCFTNYGFGQNTGVDLPRELTGNVSFQYPVDAAAASFGQGISITPIQILKALTMLTNNGKMLTPHIVSKIIDPNTNEVTYERKVEESNQIISESTIQYMKKLMYNVVNDVDNNPTGKKYKIDNLNLIGKTGTGEIFNNETNSYYKENFIFSFTGIFPEEDPKIIVFASVKRPNTASNAATINLVKPLVETLAKYYNLYDNKEQNLVSDKYVLEPYYNKSVSDIKSKLDEKSIKYVILGDGDKIINQYPKEDISILKTDTVYLLTNGKEIKMPNLKGMTRIEAISLLNLLGINYEIEGRGKVISQSVESNTLINKEETIKLVLEEKYISN